MSEEVAVQEDIAAVSGVDFGALLGDPASNPEPKTKLEKSLEVVTPQEAAAETVTEASFSFRSLLSEKDKASLKATAPAAAERMMKDYNAIINFGEPTLTRMNDMSVQLLNAQKDIKVPEAEEIVNGLLREIDGFEKKYRNQKVEDLTDKVKSFFRSTKYSFKAMVRESKPIAEKIDLAEVALKKMELRLADNVARGQQLHKNTTQILEEVVIVLAALEEIFEISKAEFNKVDTLVKETEAKATQGLASATYKGEELSLNELKEIHAQIAGSVSEIEKTLFDWRQQFFLGYSQAPSTRNLILVSATMQRRCQVFRVQGLPAARSSLALWQQAVLAEEGAELGEAVQKGINDLTQKAFGATADAVERVAMASQAPVITEETIFAVTASVKKQCESLVAADKWGREQRARNLKAMEAGEKQVDADFTQSRRQLVENAMAGSSENSMEKAPAVDADILGQLGVK